MHLCSGKSAVAIYDSHKSELRRKKKKYKHSTRLRHFSYVELEAATNGFSPCKLLGKGSHGAVFFASLDGGSLAAAVKVPTTSVSSSAENELDILSKIHSRRIVNLIGYAIDSRERKLLLVVEYMPKGSLYDLIHNNPNPPVWTNRFRFALQVAKAVRTLHGLNPPVIHRDIKSSNVLVDERRRARLSDLGLAVKGHVEEMRMMSTPPAGTLGYLDPCYLAPEDLSPKSDVFSFGIFLLEIVSGRRAIDVDFSPSSIVEWALPLIESREFQGICDRRIRWPTDQKVVRELGLLAARCVRSAAEKRPEMEEVVDILERINKRVNKIRIWNRLRWRVECIGRYWPLDEFNGSDGEDQRRISSRRSFSGRRKKVYDVPSIERSFDWIVDEMTRGSHEMGRSKSIGSFSFRELKVGPDECKSKSRMVKSRSHVRVKVSTVRKLSKSKSMSVLHGSKNIIHCSNIISPEVKVRDVLPLLVNSTTNRKSSP